MKGIIRKVEALKLRLLAAGMLVVWLRKRRFGSGAVHGTGRVERENGNEPSY